MHGSTTPSGRKKERDLYVQRRAVCPRKAVNGTKKDESQTSDVSCMKHIRGQG